MTNRFLTLLVCVSLNAVPAWAGSQGWVRVSEEKKGVVLEESGISSFVGVSSAVFVDAKGSNQRVGTWTSPLMGNIRETQGPTPFGDAVISEATFGSKDSPYQYTLTVKRLKQLRAFTVQAVFHNHSDADVKLGSFDLLDTRKDSGGRLAVVKPEEWLVTPLMQDSPALPLPQSAKRIGEAALFYRPENGFLVGPVGPAEAYTAIQTEAGAFLASVEMDRVLVRAGESRRSEEMIFAFEPVATATDLWTRWVAQTHGARLHRGPVYGWCSWYDRTTKIDEAHVVEVVKTIEANPDVFGKGVIQIDDGYQKMDGDWSANDKFPAGMAALAQRIRAAGGLPGVWFAPLMISPSHPWMAAHPDAIQSDAKGIASFMNANPFHPDGANWINPSHPESKKFLSNIIKDARDRGFGYIKIDFNGIGSRFVDPTKTRLQIFRELYALYREAAGEDMYILSCLGQPNRGVIGFVDAARVGPDSHPAHFDHCLNSVLRFQIFQDVWWQNDPDVSYLAPKLESRQVGHTPQGEGMWRSWHNSVGLVGGTAMISEPINKADVQAVWRNYEIMRPASREPARLLTLGQSPDNTVFGFAASRPYGGFAVYNLYNPTKEPMSVSLDFKTAGLPANVKCAVFDFWRNQVIGYATNEYTSALLPPLSSQLLRLTPVEVLEGDRPVLLGSTLHLSVGATEIENMRVSSAGITIIFSSAGAQDGCLTFYSKTPLKLVDSKNCEVTSVKGVGDNIWQVNVTGRKWSRPQSVELKLDSSSLLSSRQ